MDRKNELKMFCTETEEKICEGCLADHEGHCVVRVCRYMYTDVVPMANLEKQLNVSCVQSYINNGHRVLYLDRTNQQKSKLAQTGTCCRRCGRTLADGFLYCSVRCMLDSTRPEVSSEGVSFGCFPLLLKGQGLLMESQFLASRSRK